MKKNVLAVLLATLWMVFSEFVRNEWLLKPHWVSHYQNMGLVFPAEPINGMIWVLWSLCFALAIFFIGKKFSLVQTTFLAWFAGFVLMWLAIGNMGVLPFGILPYAIPLSLLEVFLAAFIIRKITE
ncbi:MAG: hypothetical protein ACOC12_02155 [Bacteroidota bacterium]